MDNSDDYFTELDLVLDEQTEAALVESEQKYLTQSIPFPVTKKFKTTTGWKPGLGAHAHIFGDLDNLPEIFVQNDSYCTSDGDGRTSSVPWKEAETLNDSTDSGLRRGRQIISAPPRSNNLASQLAQNSTIRAASTIIRQQPPSSSSTFRRGGASQVSRQPSPVVLPSNLNSRMVPPGGATAALHPLEDQISRLRQQLEELRESNKKAQSALQEALEIKIAKEGEATILRKTIEKNTRNHAEQIAHLKAAKDEADQKQLQMQKEMKDEVERLKTQYIFKQNELEVSLRKAPSSIRAKKHFREFPSTPLIAPAAIRDWHSTIREPSNQGSFNSPNASKTLKLVSQKEPLLQSPEKPKKSAMLPGFQNSFVTSTPLRPTQFKGKGKSKEEDAFGAYRQELLPPLSYHPQIFSSPTERQQDLESNLIYNQHLGHERLPTFDIEPDPAQILEEDVVMVDDSDEEMSSDEVDLLQPINWKAELARLILTHMRPACGCFTFQLLLSVNLTTTPSSNIPIEQEYISACSVVIEVISNTIRHDDYGQSLNMVSKMFVSIMEMLSDANLLSPLSSLLNMLTVLVFHLPDFRSSLLSQPNQDDGSSRVLATLCNFVTRHITTTNTNEHKDLFAAEVLTLIESLCFQVSEDLEPKLAQIPRNREAMLALLHPSQPAPTLNQTSRMLVLLSTHHRLFRAFLSIPDPEDVGRPEETFKNVIIERVCSHLIDPSRDGPVFYDFKDNILMAIAQLSISHPDAHATLTGSYVLIASLVLYVTQLTTPLWEDDETLMKSAEATISIVNMINRCVYLIHHLVFSAEPVLNLRHKLQHAPQRPFNSILQMFIVTFGRLSYADPPDWIPEQGRNDLEQFTDMARDILELVVDGPEGDGVWNAYQEDLEGEAVIDEEEMEARLMGDDVG